MNQTNIDDLTLEQLKAIAFDLVCQRDAATSNLNIVIQQITKVQQGQQGQQGQQEQEKVQSPSNLPKPGPQPM